MSARPPGKWANRRLNVLQVCDHPGWDGSRMHGVKRLFSWMIPRFDAGLLDILTDQGDAVLVPRRNAAALADRILWAMDRPGARARIGAAARITGRHGLLHELSRATRRQGVQRADLSFLVRETSG